MENGAPVAVIGGGYAGCAAAATLAAAGVRCTLYEMAPVLGGRGRRVIKDALVQQVAPDARAFLRRPLALVPFAPSQRDAISLVVRRAPGRLGLALGLLAAGGLSWRERMANLAWFRALERDGFVRPRGETVAAMLAPLPRNVRERLWTPLCLAALNTPIGTASAQVFANVLRASFTGRGEDCDFVLPITDLSAFLPEAVATFIHSRGGEVVTGVRARVVRNARDGVIVAADDTPRSAAAAIVAVGPHRLAEAFAPEALAGAPALRSAIEALEPLAYEPIATIWLGYPVRIDLPGPIARLDDAPGQWVIERPDILAAAAAGAPRLAQLLAVVISASGPHLALAHDVLVRETDAQLRRLRPDLPPLAWSFAIVEKRATYACTPGRPVPIVPAFAPGVFLAGDYAYPDLPATLEAAVRSGVAAARAALAAAPGAASVSHP